MPRRLPQPPYDRSPPHEAILETVMAPKSSPNYLDYGKTKQVKLPHLRESSVSQKGTREHSECSLRVIGETLRLPNRDVRFGSKADICSAKRHVRFTPKSGHLQRTSRCPLCANSGLMHCSKQHRYSITSSAVVSSDGGIVRPSVFAVFRLITNSNFVGCTTGRSAGFSPLRIRPA